jgi:hypothetical protein
MPEISFDDAPGARARVYGTAGSPVGMTAWDVWLVGVRPEPVGESSRVVFAGDYWGTVITCEA